LNHPHVDAPGGERELREVFAPVARAVAERARQMNKTICVGLNGAQGSGKTTFARVLTGVLGTGFGLRCATLSIDDIYLGRAERQRLAHLVHPLLLTRGVPGTHEVRLGLELISELRSANSETVIEIPVFDKASDDRAPPERWKKWQGSADLILFEGWCVGAFAQDPGDLDPPVNRLEREQDANGRWRRYVNDRLARDYPPLFAEIDLLIFLQVPDLECSLAWRIQQERELHQRAERRGLPAPRAMSDAEIERFVMHYQRLSRHMLRDLPDRADIVIPVAADHALQPPLIRGR
jgi:D-glycerate 3-kinase